MDEKIDFIITWVDPSDAEWQRQFQKFNSATSTDSNSAARFRDFETVKYVLRGIDKFTPWVNKIHFVTSGHKPAWLDLNNTKLNFVTHADIFTNKSHLPTFNSLAIEMNFLNIQNLEDKFVVFNDDMLILKSTEKTVFFRDGLPCDFLIQNLAKGLLVPLLYPDSSFVQSVNNSLAIVNKKFDKKTSIRDLYTKYINPEYGRINNLKNYIANFSSRYNYIEHYHQPQPYLKSIWQAAFRECDADILRTSSHRFRSRDDIIHYLFRYWQLIQGKFIPRLEDDFATATISSESQARTCIRLMREKRFLCVNDVPELSDVAFEKAKTIILSALEGYLPDKSQFEV